MAGGKLTPRQKMINLMYLVFIAMLALNMSKEVLSAFGLMNERFEAANTASNESNQKLLADLDLKASESKGDFIAAAATAHNVEAATKKFYDFIETCKAETLKKVKPEENGKLPYEQMDKGENLDNSWFIGDDYTKRGKEVMAAIETYKAEMRSALSDPKYKVIVAEVEKAFDTKDVTTHEGLKDKFLNYHFKGFPAIASLSKLSAWQSDVKKAESEVYNSALGKAAVDESSYKRFEAIVVLDKNAYFQGENVTGKVVLGKYDPNAKFSGFKGPGKLVNGQAVISMTAGGVGEQTIQGSFNFTENGKPIPLPFKGSYVVVPRPNEATISADKMNVVYRGVKNPMTISFAGVAQNEVRASAPGLKDLGKGKYMMEPGSGTEVKINVNAKLPDGKSVADTKVFRIKNIPNPEGTIGGTSGLVKGQKSRLEASTIGASLPDFDFEVQLNVVQFSMKVTGQPTVVVNGNKLNAQAKAALARTSRGDQVTFSEIKTKLVGSQIDLRKTAPVIYEIQ